MRHSAVLADDHVILLEGLRRLLEPEFDVLAAVTDGRALVAAVESHRPDVAVVDVSMPLLNGLEAMRQTRAAKIVTRFVFLTASADVNLAAQAIRLGGVGYVLKHSAGEELVVALRAALKGHTYISPLIADAVSETLLNHPTAHDSGMPELTAREREVLQLLAEGRTLKEAAAVLNVSARTVEFHKNNIMEKTGFRTTAELTRFAIKAGLIFDA